MKTLDKFSNNQIQEEFIKRFTKEPGQTVDSSKDIYEYLSTIYAELSNDVEHFVIVYLDGQNQIIKNEVLFSGTINSAAVYPREIIKKILEYEATAIIISHNHPSGVLEASNSDRALTKKIQEFCGYIDVKLLDHLIMGNYKYLSFSDKGLI